MQDVAVMDSTKIPKPPDTSEILVGKYSDSKKLKVEEKNDSERQVHKYEMK